MSGALPLRIAIRELVEFMERQGDINFRFSSRTSAIEGIRGHQRVQRARGKGYVAEKEVSTEVRLGEIAFCLGGRVDGYFPDRRPMEVEEIKTLRVPAAQVPAAIAHLHWSQAMIYGWLLAEQHEVDCVLIRLCYVNVDDNREETFERHMSRAALMAHFDDVTSRYAAWLGAVSAWRKARDITIASLGFPYGGYRAGQREMAVSAYRALKHQQQLVLQAPTGIGKTMAALFPAIKALRELGYEKVFFLTAKTSGQETAERSVADLKRSGLAIKDITLTAKDKVCLTPGAPCDARHCEFASGYYDRLPAVLRTVMAENASFSRDAIDALARRYKLCPFELSLDLSRLCDLVICDYNYVFDPTVYLRRYFDDTGRRFALLVDESHNLVERGREMFSAAIEKQSFLALRRQMAGQAPLLEKALLRVNNEILALRRPVKSQLERDSFAALQGPPEKVISALRRFCELAEAWLDENAPAPFQPALLESYFESLRFIRTSEWFDEDYASLIEHTAEGILLRLYNVNPAGGLAKGLQRGAASLCFSATMTPAAYFRRLMGLSHESPWYRIASPFDPRNLGVFSAPFISTAYRDRDSSLESLADLVADVVSARRGNYLVFLPSHAYLTKLCEVFAENYPGIASIRQHRAMSEPDREAFLSAFAHDAGQDTLVGFAVMGGVFGEAVDLQGTRLIGVIVVGVGLPGVGVERNLIRSYFDADSAGFEFAYQYPGINKVLQTAGRVIRSETDRGIVCLVDRRFRELRYRRLLPAEWRVEECGSASALSRAIADFWRSHRFV